MTILYSTVFFHFSQFIFPGVFLPVFCFFPPVPFQQRSYRKVGSNFKFSSTSEKTSLSGIVDKPIFCSHMPQRSKLNSQSHCSIPYILVIQKKSPVQSTGILNFSIQQFFKNNNNNQLTRKINCLKQIGNNLKILVLEVATLSLHSDPSGCQKPKIEKIM